MSLLPLVLSVAPQLDVEVSDERDAIQQTAALLKNHEKVCDFPGFLQAVWDRQRINPPVLSNGVALPHARTHLVNEIVCAAIRCAKPVPFGPDHTPVRLVFLFGIPPQRISEYLALTAALVKRLRNPQVLEGLLRANLLDDFQRYLSQ